MCTLKKDLKSNLIFDSCIRHGKRWTIKEIRDREEEISDQHAQFRVAVSKVKNKSIHNLTLLILSFSLANRIESQTCPGSLSPYGPCSSNLACGCLSLTATENSGICAFLDYSCSALTPCAANNRTCPQSGHFCVKHPQCSNNPVCYPMEFVGQTICPPMTTLPPISPPLIDGICTSATWNQKGIIAAGKNAQGSVSDQLSTALGMFLDNDGVLYIADGKERVFRWIPGDLNGQVVAGGNGRGSDSNQFSNVVSIVVDKYGTMFMCDLGNRRVQRWFKNAKNGQTYIFNISCKGLAIDNEGLLYVSDSENRHVTQWPGGRIVAKGNNDGSALNELQRPFYILIDRDQSLLVADFSNHVVGRWPVASKNGIVVAGGNGVGNNLNQLNLPTSMVTDQMGTLYILDTGNKRVLRVFKGSTSADIIIGGRDPVTFEHHIATAFAMVMDRHGNLYVADTVKNQVLMFAIDKSTCLKV